MICGKFAISCEPRWFVARLLCEARRERGAGPHRDVGPGESGEPGLIPPDFEARRKRGAGPQMILGPGESGAPGPRHLPRGRLEARRKRGAGPHELGTGLKAGSRAPGKLWGPAKAGSRAPNISAKAASRRAAFVIRWHPGTRALARSRWRPLRPPARTLRPRSCAAGTAHGCLRAPRPA